MSFDEERLRILERVSNGELTPQQGSLEIAMLKVQVGPGGRQPDTATTAGVTDIHDAPRSGRSDPFRVWSSHFERRDLHTTPWPVIALLLVPIMVMAGVVVTALSFFLALPAYVLMTLWNAQVVPAVAGVPVLGFFTTLAVLVGGSLVWIISGWFGRLKR